MKDKIHEHFCTTIIETEDWPSCEWSEEGGKSKERCKVSRTNYTGSRIQEILNVARN